MRVQVTRTYLEMRSPGELQGRRLEGPGLLLAQVQDCPVSFHRYLYAEVGRPYHWRDRLSWSEERLRAYLDDPGITLHVLYVEGAPAGYFELRRVEDGSIEIAYFGLLQEYLGRGLGTMLLTEAVIAAWGLGANRVWLHTCTLDDPAALPNYRKRGFQPAGEETYEQEIP